MPLVFSYPDMACPRNEDIDAIRQEIPITFGEVPWSPMVCDGDPGSRALTWIEERTYSSLIFLRDIRFTEPLPAAWTAGPGVYDWLRGAIRGIVVETGERSWCCSPEKVIHLRVADPSGVPAWRRTIDTSWATLIVHEARHADTGIPHTCPTDQTKDARTSDMGAYGVQYWLMIWIANYSDQPGEIRDWYRWSAKAIRRSAFCLECANPL